MTRWICVGSLVVCVLLACVSAAFGLGAQSVILGFGATYVTPEGQTRTHRGVDLACAPGDIVAAPVAGTVAFAGAVPGALGGTVQAVSIDSEHGRVTLMPFEQLCVEKGERVGEDDRLGTVAAGGDGSSGEVHVHLSLRREGLYLDPAVLLAVEPSQPQSQKSGTVESGADLPVPAPAPAAAGYAVSADAPTSLQPGVSLASAESMAGQGAPAPGAPVDSPVSEPTAGCASQVGGVALARGVSLAPPPAEAVTLSRGTQVATLHRADRSARASVSPAFQSTSAYARSLMVSLSSLGLAVPAGLLLIGCCGALLLRVRAFEQGVATCSPVSHRLGKMLQLVRTGATLRGLTSCPGHAAFTVPGPTSPGEVTK